MLFWCDFKGYVQHMLLKSKKKKNFQNEIE